MGLISNYYFLSNLTCVFSIYFTYDPSIGCCDLTFLFAFGGITLSDFKTCSKVIVIKIAYYWTGISTNRTIENPEINSHIYG
jgi:hypothetical protein